jgi:putative ABC transport system permease protein
MRTIWQDIRYGSRMFLKSPGFAVTVVLTLAIGIGANTAIFSAVNAVLLTPLPYQDSDRIVALWEERKAEGIEEMGTSARNFVQWRQQNHVFDSLVAWNNPSFYVTGLAEPIRIRAVATSWNVFSMLGVQPLLGRGFLPEEEEAGKDRVVVLNHAFWRDRFGADPNAIGRTLRLDEQDYTIVGVMPSGFEFPFRYPAPLWVPLVLPTKDFRQSLSRQYCAVARLKKGVTVEQARADMAVIARRLAEIDPQRNGGYSVTLNRLLDDAIRGNRTLLLLLLGTVGFVLLIACINIANLMLARVPERQREIALRMALGASRSHIVRQVLIESIVLSSIAGMLGLLVAFWAIKGLIGFCPVNIPRISETRVDAMVLAFTLGLSTLTGLVFGLFPAWKTADVNLNQALKEVQTRSTTIRGSQCLRGGLVVSQIAIALTLLLGAALLIQSLIALQRADLGFRPENAITMQIELPRSRYPDSHHCKAFFNELLQRVQTLPSVRSAALTNGKFSLTTSGGFESISIDGRPKTQERLIAKRVDITPDYFKAMGISILRGRGLQEEDMRDSSTYGLVIDENMARNLFADVDPIGQRIWGNPIVGIVSTIKDFDTIMPVNSTFYRPVYYFNWMTVVIRTDGDPMRLAGALRGQVSALDRDLPSPQIRTLEAMLTEMLGPRSWSIVVLGFFAGVAMILAAIGIYGLLQYLVTQQTHEVGVRMALGATRIDIARMVLRRGLKLTLIGLAIGLTGALATTRVIRGLLYEVGPTDPLTFVCVSILLAGVTLLATYIPARRAARIDPMEALRYE